MKYVHAFDDAYMTRYTRALCITVEYRSERPEKAGKGERPLRMALRSKVAICLPLLFLWSAPVLTIASV